jgi:hypothetical protein
LSSLLILHVNTLLASAALLGLTLSEDAFSIENRSFDGFLSKVTS